MLGIGQIGSAIGRIGATTPNKGGATGPFPAPAGYRWAFVTERNVQTTERSTPVVTLERVA